MPRNEALVPRFSGLSYEEKVSYINALRETRKLPEIHKTNKLPQQKRAVKKKSAIQSLIGGMSPQERAALLASLESEE